MWLAVVGCGWCGLWCVGRLTTGRRNGGRDERLQHNSRQPPPAAPHNTEARGAPPTLAATAARRCTPRRLRRGSGARINHTHTLSSALPPLPCLPARSSSLLLNLTCHPHHPATHNTHTHSHTCSAVPPCRRHNLLSPPTLHRRHRPHRRNHARRRRHRPPALPTNQPTGAPAPCVLHTPAVPLTHNPALPPPLPPPLVLPHAAAAAGDATLLPEPALVAAPRTSTILLSRCRCHCALPPPRTHTPPLPPPLLHRRVVASLLPAAPARRGCCTSCRPAALPPCRRGCWPSATVTRAVPPSATRRLAPTCACRWAAAAAAASIAQVTISRWVPAAVRAPGRAWRRQPGKAAQQAA